MHGEVLRKFGAEIKVRHPDLGIELLLMALDGKVETIA